MESYEKEALLVALDSSKKIWPGCYRGKVESIDDPDRLDRVKVRVWAIHRDDTATPDSALPWADVNEIGGGGYDFGGYNPPPVGSSVWVMFEGGDSDYPVVIGTFRGVPKRDDINSNVFLVKDQSPVVESPWTPPDEETETPKDVFEDVDGGDPHPTKRVWQKSYKGHTIVIDDGDGKESFKIIDRAGQIIEFDCAVDAEYAASNNAQRGVRDASRGDQLPHDALRDKRAAIRIKDLSGQELVFDSRNMDERITLKSKSKLGGENKIVLRSGKGKNSIELRDSGGDFVRLDPHSDTPIVIQDSTGNGIIFDKATGQVRIVGTKTREEDLPQKTTTVRGKKRSDIRGDEVKQILGNKKTSVMNDVLQSVLGNAQVSLGGALKMMLTNQSPSGSEEKALDIQVNNPTGGDFAFQTLNGNIDWNTILGSIQMSVDTTGDMVTQSGQVSGNNNVDAPAATGKVLLGNALLPVGPNPVPGASQESLIRGSYFNQMLTVYLTALSASWSTRAGVAASFSNTLPIGLVLNFIPAVGNTLFTTLMGPLWEAYAVGETTAFGVQSAAAAALLAALPATLSTKSSTQ